MCGRYKLSAKERYLRDHFGLEEDPDWEPRWNIAPTQQVPIVRQERKKPRRTFGLVRWGLIPHWAKNALIGVRAINAVSETAAEKPVFREAMRGRRCLVPADGFYEWQRLDSKSRQPYNFELADNGLFAFAGLWERWKDPAGEPIETCTILTTTPNALVQDVHDRMPVLLQPNDYELWLDPGVTDPVRVTDLLKPFDARLMRKYPVSTFVNRTVNEGPECAREVDAASGSDQHRLF